MTELKKTLIFVAVALVLSASAVVATRSRDAESDYFKQKGQGELFFPNFKDPLECTELEVIDYDPATAKILPFNVKLSDGKWVIPSHNNYPADAKDRLAKTASSVMDLRKDVFVSDQPDKQEQFDVIDPKDMKNTSLKGRGKRVTLKNKSGEILASYIFGKEVPGRPGQRYVRVPDKKAIYAVNASVELSSRFADWIEPNLLKLDATHVRNVTFDNHKVDPEARTITRGDVFTIERKDSSAPWTLEGLKADEEVNTSKVSSLTSALSDLKIVGVRPKPAGLTRELKASSDGNGISLSGLSQQSLMTRGFYVMRDGRLLSNHGDVIVSTDEGVTYTLRFGEVTFASGEELSAGSAKEGQPKSEDGKAKKPEGAQESRYLFVTADFDPTLLPEAPTPPEADQEELPADVFQLTKKERDGKEKAAKDKYEREKADYDRKVDEGKKRAKELTDRFADWYYVVPGDAFRNVVLDRAALVQAKSAKPSDDGPAGLPGGLPGMPGLPGGFKLPGGAPHP